MEMAACRICLTKYEPLLISLFINFDEKLMISDCLLFVCALEVNQEDQLPKFICQDCLEKVKVAYEVKVQSLETDKFLRDCLEQKIKGASCLQLYEETKFDCQSDSDCSTKSKSHRSSNKPEKCFICDKEFSHKNKKIEHLRSRHETGGSQQCHICQYIVKNAKKLDSHIKYHYHPPEFVCELCGKGFSKKENLKLHHSMHSSSVSYSCDHCSKRFKYKENLKRHVKLHLVERRFRCEECNEGFTTQGCLNNHRYKNHDVEAPIKCIDCSRGFTYMSELKNHKNRFGKCPVPREESERQQKAQVQINPVSNKFQCLICHREYKHLRALQFHLKFHSENKPTYKCEQCCKNFHNSGNLQRHKMIHQNLKPHKCEYCEKSFNQKEKLIVHRRTHTGEKPFECTLCLKRFSDPSCYSKHIKNIHSDSVGKK